MLKNPLYLYGDTNIELPLKINLGEHVLDSLVKHEDKPAFINAETNETITFREIAQNAVNLAVSLRKLGVKKGDVIAICSENRREFWSTVVGGMTTGAVITPINIQYSANEFKHVMSISKPKYIFCSPFTYKLHKESIKTVKSLQKVILYGNDVPSPLIAYNGLVAERIRIEDFRAVDVVGQVDPVAILYSSGTTGLPKGVVLTHYSGLVSTSILNTKGAFADVVAVTVAPWYHAMGLWSMISSMCNGRTIIYLMKFEEKLYLETIQKYKPAFLTMVPPILVLLSKSQILDNYDVSSVFVVYCGAAPVDLETINDVKKRFPNLMFVLQAYGMTEVTLAITKDSLDSPNGSRPGSVGTVTQGSIIKIVDIETRKPLGPNQQGEICVHTPMVMKGYIGKDTKDDFDEEGFFKTGDIGYYDNDKFIYIVDRLKELIKYKAYQVAPAEIEAELLQHPAVRDAGVVGVKNKAAGEVPLAFIVKQPGMEVTADELKKFIAERLSNPKHLRGGVKFIDEIPKNPSGKILRRHLRSLLDAKKSKL